MKTHLPYGMKLLDNYTACLLRKAGFFRQMADDSLIAFEKVSFTSWYPTGAVLFIERQVPRGVYMLCQGRVKLTVASPEGKTIIVRVAKAGELLGLDSVVPGDAYEITTETLQPCQVGFVRREDFLKLLHEHWDIAVSVVQQVSNYYRGACPNKLEERQDWLEQQLSARPQDVVLKPGVVDYAVQEYGRERQPALSGLSSELGRPRKRKANWRPN